MARLLQVLDTYDFEIEHRAGKRHGNADAMSRGPYKQFWRKFLYFCGRRVNSGVVQNAVREFF